MRRKTDRPTVKAGSEGLPRKFTAAERRAYDWISDCGIRPWLVDLLTKEVRTPHGKYQSLVAYAHFCGMEGEQ